MPAGPPKGNINAVRRENVPAVFFRRVQNSQPVGGLFRHHPWLLRLYENYERELIDAKGGEGVISPLERRSLEIAGAARRCWAHALAEGDTGTAKRFMDVERNTLASVGLERREKPVTSLDAYVADRYGSK